MSGNKEASRRRLLCGALFMMAASLAAWALEKTVPSNARFSAEVNVVSTFVTVRDKNGKIVKDLTKEDFRLWEEGKKQTIEYFSRESDLPLTIGLIIDTTPSEEHMLEMQRSACMTFLNRMLRPGIDAAFLCQYYSSIELLQNVTTSREKLEAALNRLKGHNLATIQAADPSFSWVYTILGNAVYLTSERIMNPRPGRKALIILGDGDHIGKKEQKAIEAAQRAETMIYAIRIRDKDFGIVDEKAALKRLTGKTGGFAFDVKGKQTLDQIFGIIEEELRSQYSLGYTPDANAEKKYRRIRIEAKQWGTTARGRVGYYPK